MAKKKYPKEIVIAGIACLTLLEAIALLKGINGTLFTMIVAVIACAIGVTIPTPKIK